MQWRYKVRPSVPRAWSNLAKVLLPQLTGDQPATGYHTLPFVEVKQGQLTAPSGSRMVFKDLRVKYDGTRTEYTYVDLSKAGGKERLYGGKVLQMCSQWLQNEFIVPAMHTFEQRTGHRPFLSVYDEICTVVPEQEADACLAELLTILKTPPTWWPDIPLNAEGSHGDSYADAK